MTQGSPKEDYLALMLDALTQPFGITVVTSGGRDRARAKFYEARRKHAPTTPGLDKLQIRLHPAKDDELVLIHEEGKNGPRISTRRDSATGAD